MTMKLDRNVEAVMEFLERNVEADKLVRVATTVATLAPIIWGNQVPLGIDRLVTFIPESCHEQLSTATQLHPVQVCAGDGSAVASDTQ